VWVAKAIASGELFVTLAATQRDEYENK